MSSRIKSVLALLPILILVIFCCSTKVVVAAPYQHLPPRAEHIPVYIREGNQPLNEIHPGLAEAFHEVEELQHKPEADNSKILSKNDDRSGESKDNKDVKLSSSSPLETDIASFDVIKNIDDKSELLTKNEDKEQKLDQDENYEKKQSEGAA